MSRYRKLLLIPLLGVGLMLTPSVTPAKNRAASETAKIVEAPKTIMLTPNPATHSRSVRPA